MPRGTFIALNVLSLPCLQWVLMMQNHLVENESANAVEHSYRHALAVLLDSRIEFLVCGAYAFEAYTEIRRNTKDLDIFVRPGDCRSALAALARAGFRT